MPWPPRTPEVDDHVTQTNPAPASATAVSESRTQANSLLEVSPAFSNLGSTTATRSWVALGAAVLVLAGALAWGLFGTVTLQQSVEAISVGNGLTYEVSAPKAGRIALISPVDQIYAQGDPIATVVPDDGSAPYTLNAPAQLLLTSWDAVLGSPVGTDVPIGRGVLLGLQPDAGGLATEKSLVAITFVSHSDYEVFANAVSIDVEVLNVGGQPISYPATMVAFSAYPSSQDRITQLTGNATFAADITEQTGGDAYMVSLGFADPEDAQAVAQASQSGDPGSITSGRAATVVITEVSDSPLQVLFGSGA